MSKTEQVDDLTSEEINAIDEFYASDDGKVTFKTAAEFIKWLNE